MANEQLECDVQNVEMAVAHKVDTLKAFFHFIEVNIDIVAFFGSETIEVPHVDDKGLVPFVVVHAFEVVPHVEGCLTLVYMDHLSICNVALYLHTCEGIVLAPVLPAAVVNIDFWVLDGACDIFKHATGFECSSHFGLPDNPVCFIKGPSEPNHRARFAGLHPLDAYHQTGHSTLIWDPGHMNRVMSNV